MKKINIDEKLSQFSEHWSPKIVAELNGQQVKVAKLLGEFDWHFHENEDELFWVIRGSLEMHIREADAERSVEINPGEVFVVPRGVMHKPVAKSEVELVLFEPASTLNTGNVKNERTQVELKRI